MAIDDTVDVSAEWYLQPGKVIDHYEVSALLGYGGMGEVYLARDQRLGRKVALKVIHRDALGAADAVRRFLMEARIIARLNHPQVITIFDVGVFEDRPYLALEYLGGKTLGQRLVAGPVTLPDVLRISAEIAKGLAFAHGKGILHRDLKPDNIMLTDDGQVKILDFGLAKIASASHFVSGIGHHDSDDIFESGSTGVSGTPAFMAPEQWRSESQTGATDIWAFSSILYKMVTGTTPYLAKHIRAQRELVCGSAPVPAIETPNLPSRLAPLILSGLQKDPSRRPTATEMMEELGHILESDHRPADEAYTDPPSDWKPRAAFVGALGVLAALGIVLTLAWVSGSSPEPQALPRQTNIAPQVRSQTVTSAAIQPAAVAAPQQVETAAAPRKNQAPPTQSNLKRASTKPKVRPATQSTPSTLAPKEPLPKRTIGEGLMDF